NRRGAVRRIDVDDVACGNGVAAEATRVGRIAHFENASADVAAMGVEKRLDVVAIDRLAAVHAPAGAQRTHASEIAPPDARDPVRLERRGRIRDLLLQIAQLMLERRDARVQVAPVFTLT